MFESWKEIRKYRKEKGISREALSRKMRLSVERIAFLEAGDFSDADPVITRLQLKEYARHLGVDYDELLALSGLQKAETPDAGAAGIEKVNIKKTHSYRGRRKKISKTLLYSLVTAAVLLLIFLLNRVAENFSGSEDFFEMTRKQPQALVNDSAYLHDSTLFRPVLPQSEKLPEKKDITGNMQLRREYQIRFPEQIDCFPAKDISYRYITENGIPREDLIPENTPVSIPVRYPGRIIFYNMEDTRFVFDGVSLRDTGISRIVIDIREDGGTKLYSR